MRLPRRHTTTNVPLRATHTDADANPTLPFTSELRRPILYELIPRCALDRAYAAATEWGRETQVDSEADRGEAEG